jgi:hypothetical protein
MNVEDLRRGRGPRPMRMVAVYGCQVQVVAVTRDGGAPIDGRHSRSLAGRTFESKVAGSLAARERRSCCLGAKERQ